MFEGALPALFRSEAYAGLQGLHSMKDRLFVSEDTSAVRFSQSTFFCDGKSSSHPKLDVFFGHFLWAFFT